ncbi:MAG TPA: hypothetical protein VF522_15960 [Ramlibacter sp.]|uniref:hypothetical protein n=1 Tax=Ramlibacter sp. TaxID=1917967 RepID=UPI002ED471DB
MPYIRTPQGITPPAPGLEREEPTFVPERDIPDSDARANARKERNGSREERAPRTPERE